MLNLSHSRPLNQFQQEAPELLHQFETDKTPIVITINGKAVAVLQDAESYEKLLNRLELLETLAGIRQSLGEFEQGQGVSIHQAFEELQVFTLIDQLSFNEQQEILEYLIQKKHDEMDDTPDEIVIEGIREGLREAMSGQTIPLSQMWVGIDVE